MSKFKQVVTIEFVVDAPTEALAKQEVVQLLNDGFDERQNHAYVVSIEEMNIVNAQTLKIGD